MSLTNAFSVALKKHSSGPHSLSFSLSLSVFSPSASQSQRSLSLPMMRRRRRDAPLCEGKISNRRCTTLTRVNQRRILARGCLKMTCAHTTSTPATAFVKQRPPTLSRERYNHRNALVSSALFCGLFSILHKIRAQKNTLKFIMVRLSRRISLSRCLSLSKLPRVRNERTNLVRARIEGERGERAFANINLLLFSRFLFA